MERCDVQDRLGGSCWVCGSGPERKQPAQQASYMLFWIPARGGVRPAPHFFAGTFPGDQREAGMCLAGRQTLRPGRSSSNVVIQASTDLQTWIPLQTNLPGSGPLHFSDAQSTTNAQRFYRAVIQERLNPKAGRVRGSQALAPPEFGIPSPGGASAASPWLSL